MTKTFPEVISGIRTAKKGVEVREDIAQMGEYVEQFASTATTKASEAEESAERAKNAVNGIDQQKADAVKAVQQAQATATAAVTAKQSEAVQAVETAKTSAVKAVDDERDDALQQVANSTAAAQTAAAEAKASERAAEKSKEAASTSASTATTKASEASTSAGAASASRQAAEKAQKAAEDAAELAGTRAGTDKTFSMENAPADAKATGDALASKADKSIVQDESGNAIFYSKAEVEAKIKEAIAAALSERDERDHGVGSFYASNNPTSPAQKYGGTWERVEGKFIMGASDTYPAGSTGGSATHYHDYKIRFSWNNGAVVGYHQSAIALYNYQTGLYYLSNDENDKVGEGYTLVNTAASNASGERQSSNYVTYGSTSSSNTLNPYYSVYIWVRVDDAA